MSSTNPAIMLATTYHGVCRSSDGGKTWSYGYGPAAALDVVFDPLNPDAAYVGLEGGAARSTDRGATWSRIDLGLPPDDELPVLSVDSRNPSTLYAGTEHGVYSFANSSNPTTLYFPRLVTRETGTPGSDDSEHTELSIVNLDGVDAELTFTSYRKDGTLISGSEITNPVLRKVKAGAQFLATDVEIWGAGLPAARPEGWFTVESTAARVYGYFMMFNGSRSVIDGTTASATLIEPVQYDALGPLGDSGSIIEIDPEGFTQVHVVNPNPRVTTVDIRLNQGGIGLTSSRWIDPNASLVESLSSLFPGYVPSAKDQVIFGADEPIVLFETTWKPEKLVRALSGHAYIDNQGAGVLYCPQYIAGGANWSTTLSLVNPNYLSTTAELRLIGDHGAQIGPPRTVSIPGGGKTYVDDSSFFLSSGVSPVQGYLKITSLGPGPTLFGSVTLGDPGGKVFGAALPLTEVLMTDFVFGHVASNYGWFTGIALVNPNADPVTATMQVHDKNGSVIGSGTLVIPAGKRVSKLLTEYFPELSGADLTSGYIWVTADKGLAAFALYGASDLSSLAALPPQAVR